jgi:hypothetical protein
MFIIVDDDDDDVATQFGCRVMQHELPSIKQAVSMRINGIYLVCKQMHFRDPENTGSPPLP